VAYNQGRLTIKDDIWSNQCRTQIIVSIFRLKRWPAWTESFRATKSINSNFYRNAGQLLQGVRKEGNNYTVVPSGKINSSMKRQGSRCKQTIMFVKLKCKRRFAMLFTIFQFFPWKYRKANFGCFSSHVTSHNSPVKRYRTFQTL